MSDGREVGIEEGYVKVGLISGDRVGFDANGLDVGTFEGI